MIMNQEPGKPKFAAIMQKKLNTIDNNPSKNLNNNSTIEAPVVSTVVNKEEIPKELKVADISTSNPIENTSIEVDKQSNSSNTDQSSTKDVAGGSIADPKMQEFIKTLIKTVQESSDPQILKRHPGYKGARVKRSFALKLDHDNWLNNIYNNKHIEKTQVVQDALEIYLNEHFKEFKP